LSSSVIIPSTTRILSGLSNSISIGSTQAVIDNNTARARIYLYDIIGDLSKKFKI